MREKSKKDRRVKAVDETVSIPLKQGNGVLRYFACADKRGRLVRYSKVTTGTVEDFFSRAKIAMRAADRGEPIKKQYATLTFVDPAEMLHFLSATKIKLVNSIRNHPSSVTEIAHFTKRNRSAVYRDIHEMEKFGLVKTHEEINPGHGKYKIVELIAPVLKLEATI